MSEEPLCCGGEGGCGHGRSNKRFLHGCHVGFDPYEVHVISASSLLGQLCCRRRVAVAMVGSISIFAWWPCRI